MTNEIDELDDEDPSQEEEDLFLQILRCHFGKNFEPDFTQKDTKPYIVVDKREKRSGIVEILTDMDAIIIEETLYSGDFLLSSRVSAERKRGDDFYSSLFSGSNQTNVFDELMRLSDAVESPILIIEDFTRMFKRREDMVSSLYGALVAIATTLQIPIIPSRNINDTAIILYRIAKQQQTLSDNLGIARRVPKRMSLSTRQAFILEGLYNIGLKKSKMLLDEFGTPINFFTALLNTEIIYTKTGKPKGIKGDLEKIKGLGWKFVRDNKKLLLSKDEKEE